MIHKSFLINQFVIQYSYLHVVIESLHIKMYNYKQIKIKLENCSTFVYSSK